MARSSLPPPPVPSDADCRQLDGFLLNVERLLTSELLALSTGDEFKAAATLWCRAWKQVPAGSLPDNDRVLASFSGAGRRWEKVRSMALHGFVKCSDGRLYHLVLCEDVKRALDSQKQFRERREKDAERLRKWREKRVGNDDETRFVDRNETRSKGQDGKGRDSSSSPSNEGSKNGARGARGFSKNGGGSEAADLPEEPWPQRCDAWARGKRWNAKDGPEPGEPGCRAPPDLSAEAIRKRALNGAASAA